MEHRYSVLKKHLVELGYNQSLVIESVPLVERLLGDLVKTTESLFHYKNIAQSVIEERDHLQLGAEPYKCDNAKLVKECNDLHLAFLQFREQTDKLQKDLKYRIHTLERDNEELTNCIEDLQRASEKTCSKVSAVRKPVTAKSSSIQSKTMPTKAKKDVTSKMKKKHKVSAETEKSAAADETKVLKEDKGISALTKEVKELKEEITQQRELCECLCNKLNNRDKEIRRLSNLLEGGRPIQALNKDCCYKDMSARFSKMSDENVALVKEKKQLELQLADAITKQHEAMKRALQLADRNKELERELRDIDQMALAVEAECNSTVKQNADKVCRFQNQLDDCNIQIQEMERDLAEVKRQKQQLQVELHTVRDEKDNLQKILENALDDKKRMTDRINQFTRIEHDLNLEIDRLVQTSTLQKRRICELESQMVSGKFDGKTETEMDKKSRKSKSGSVYLETHNIVARDSINKKDTSASEKDKTIIERLEKEIEQCQNECLELRKHLKAALAKSDGSSDTNRRLSEKEDAVAKLEKENQSLMREKHNLIAQLESMQELKKWDDDVGGTSLKGTLSRVEKERDLARGDVKRLEDERDSLRKRLKSATELHMTERDRLQKVLTDSEEKFRKLENDRREMMSVQGSRRATINNLEEQIESLTSQLRTTQSELDHLHTLYSQIKTLQEQTDRALSDTQGQLTQVETEYAHGQERIRDLEKDRADLDKELSVLKNDICILRGNLASIDAERDTLLIEVDNKTERIASLEQELKMKDHRLISLETTATELKQALSLQTDDTAAKDYLIKNSTSELNALKRELEEASKAKNLALKENRRLQDDLSKVTLDWRSISGELDRANREVEDLKTQLQQYVFEIKRAEDLISKKENERAEMLDHFRSLSQEANVLETNNHTLETKAIETKTQLGEALDHVSDLENKVEQFDIMNKDYEKQIRQLSSQVAGLETQLRQHASANNKIETDLSSMKELCVKLDEQKDALKKELREKDDYRTTLEREKERLRVDVEKLQSKLREENGNLGSVEDLLAASRQETVEQTLLNQELQSEIERLKNVIKDLQSKLATTSQQLDVFQEKSLDYSQQLKQLRREVANERFHAHSGDLSSRYPSL